MKTKSILTMSIMIMFVAIGFNNITVNAQKEDEKINVLGDMTEYTIPTGSSSPIDICFNSNDRNLYFTESDPDKIGKMTNAGVFTEYTIPTDSSVPNSICFNSNDNNLYFTESGSDKIGKMTNAGVFTEYNITTAYSYPTGICFNSNDNNLYFTESGSNKIGKMTNAGVFTEYTIPTDSSSPNDICFNSNDNNLYFTENSAYKIGTMTSAGVFTEYNTTAYPMGICFNSNDNNIYFTEYSANKIGKMDTFVYVPPNPSLNDDGQFNEPTLNANVTESINFDCNGTGIDLDTQIVYIDYWIYWVSNQTLQHFDNNTADKTATEWNDSGVLELIVSEDTVLRLYARALIIPDTILFNKNNNNILSDKDINPIINTVRIVYFVSEPFTDLYNPEPVLNDDVTFIYPEHYDNYTCEKDEIPVYVYGTGFDLDYTTIEIDVYLYSYFNTTYIHYYFGFDIGYNDTEWTTWANFTYPWVNENHYYRMYAEVKFSLTLFNKNGVQTYNDNKNNPDVTYKEGYSGMFMINSYMNVTLNTPNGFENYTAGDVLSANYSIDGGLPPNYVTIFITFDNGTSWYILLDNETIDSYPDNNDFDVSDLITTYDITNTTYYCWVYVIGYDDTGEIYNDDGSDDNFTVYIAGSIPINPPPAYHEPENEYPPTDDNETIPTTMPDLWTQYKDYIFYFMIATIFICVIVGFIYFMSKSKRKKKFKHKKKYNNKSYYKKQKTYMKRKYKW